MSECETPRLLRGQSLRLPEGQQNLLLFALIPRCGMPDIQLSMSCYAADTI